MISPFASPLFAAGEILLGVSITMFAAVFVATYGDTLKRHRRKHYSGDVAPRAFS
jgi:hypothetical protein